MKFKDLFWDRELSQAFHLDFESESCQEFAMNVFWENAEKTILIREFPETWTGEEYQAAVQKTRLMLHEVSHNVIILKDCRKLRVLPRDSMTYFREGNRNVPAHVLMRILVTESTILQTLISTLQKIAPEDFANYCSVYTMQDAQRLIEESRTKEL
jgi:hypothetical protein